jgi:hypothetical protein
LRWNESEIEGYYAGNATEEPKTELGSKNISGTVIIEGCYDYI